GSDALLQALVIAAEIGEAPLTLEVLLGVARLRRGQACHAEAAELSALLLAHAATDQSARTNAGQLEAELKASLHPADLEAARERGRAAALDDAVARLLRSAPAPVPADAAA
ncbi:MAG TPA: hypothetical protein VF541_01145, partial [Longimicrobium sp.]